MWICLSIVEDMKKIFNYLILLRIVFFMINEVIVWNYDNLGINGVYIFFYSLVIRGRLSFKKILGIFKKILYFKKF